MSDLKLVSRPFATTGNYLILEDLMREETIESLKQALTTLGLDYKTSKKTLLTNLNSSKYSIQDMPLGDSHKVGVIIEDGTRFTFISFTVDRVSNTKFITNNFYLGTLKN